VKEVVRCGLEEGADLGGGREAGLIGRSCASAGAREGAPRPSFPPCPRKGRMEETGPGADGVRGAVPYCAIRCCGSMGGSTTSVGAIDGISGIGGGGVPRRNR